MVGFGEKELKLTLFMTRGMSLEKWERGGVLTRELALYEKLAKRGLQTTIISWGDKKDYEYVKNRDWLKVRVNSFGLSTAKYEQFLPVVHAKTFFSSDIIKTNQMNGAEVAVRCAKFWRVPFIARCGFMLSFSKQKQGRFEDAKKAKTVETEAYSMATHGIVSTPKLRSYLVSNCHIEESRISVVPNYVPDYFFKKRCLEKSSESLSRRPVVLAIGRLSPEKNLFALVEACSGLDVTLRLVGEGALQKELIEKATDLGVTLELPGKLEHSQLVSEIHQATVFAQVSLYEGHPKALLEAMACGAAILASNSPGVVDVVEDGVTALVCSPSHTSIREKLLLLLGSPEQRRRLGSEAFSTAKKEYDINVIAEKEWQIYTDIM